MVSCMGELFIWTLKNQTIISDHDIGCHTYHDKGETVSNSDQPYYEEKMHYTESRDVSWTPKNRRPDKIRDLLKESEEILSTHRCVYCAWRAQRTFQVLLANGTCLSFVHSPFSGDIHKMFIDKSLLNKFSAESLLHAVVTDSFIVASVPEKARLDYVCFSKKISSMENLKKFEKLSAFEPKFSQVELPGPTGRRLERHLSCNINQNLILAWWPTASEEAWPWSPMSSEKERANLIILAATGAKLEVMCFTRTECDPVHAQFSAIQPHQIFTIEQAPAAGKEINVDLSLYEIARNKIHRVAVTSIPLKNSVITQGRNYAEDRVLLGCDDGTLVLYDENRRLTETVKSNLHSPVRLDRILLEIRAIIEQKRAGPPTLNARMELIGGIPASINWHPSGTIILVASSRGEVQLYDIALNPLLFQLMSEEHKPLRMLELGLYFRSPPTLSKVMWCPFESQTTDGGTSSTDSLLMAFDRGPLAVLQLSLGLSNYSGCLQLVNQYIKHREIGAAVNLLASLNWNIEGQDCYNCLNAIVTHLLRLPLNADRESQLEAALGTFYAPTRPLSEAVVLEFRDPISRFARRFFHHLLRHSRFDKAFLLAVDIGARDLFMDIHYLAQDKGELALAEVAKKKAEQIDNESTETDAGSETNEDEELSGDGYSNGDSYYDDESDTEMDKTPSHRQQPTRGMLQQPFYQPRHSTPHVVQHRQSGIDTIDYSYEDDPEISAQLMDEYAAALEDDVPPKPQEGDKTSNTVKVIHFGVV